MTNAQLHGCKFDGWQCFHCGEVFETVGGAADHFGVSQGTIPGCLMRVQLGDERGLLMEVRKLEKELISLRADLENETTSRELYAGHLQGELLSYAPFRKCKTLLDVFNVYDSEEGRRIAAESQLQAARDDLAKLQAAFNKARTDAHTCQFELAEIRAKNLKVVAVVEESERDGCDLFVAKIRWLFNPVPEGEELYWSHPSEKQKSAQEKL